MIRYLSFLGALLALSLAACDGATAPDLSGEATLSSATEAPLGPARLSDSDALKRLRATIGFGQTFTFEETGAELSFDVIHSDSRCPAYLDCVVDGEARAGFTFHDGNGAEYAINLGIPGGSPLELDLAEVKPAFAAGYAFRLVRLQPYPGYGPDYGVDNGRPGKATLVVEPCAEPCH